eukprot:SAG31_NODE_3938_length_3735_cov_3.200220_1_plen_93_part_00
MHALSTDVNVVDFVTPRRRPRQLQLQGRLRGRRRRGTSRCDTRAQEQMRALAERCMFDRSFGRCAAFRVCDAPDHSNLGPYILFLIVLAPLL